MRRKLRCLYLAANMFICAVLFFGIARERETISSLVGRYAYRGNRVARIAEKLINALHPREPHHCLLTYLDEEEDMRKRWYPPYD